MLDLSNLQASMTDAGFKGSNARATTKGRQEQLGKIIEMFHRHLNGVNLRHQINLVIDPIIIEGGSVTFGKEFAMDNVSMVDWLLVTLDREVYVGTLPDIDFGIIDEVLDRLDLVSVNQAIHWLESREWYKPY